jgi:hypothetical protein
MTISNDEATPAAVASGRLLTEFFNRIVAPRFAATLMSAPNGVESRSCPYKPFGDCWRDVRLASAKDSGSHSGPPERSRLRFETERATGSLESNFAFLMQG